MPKARLVFDGDNVYIGKDARIYWLKNDIATKIDWIPWVIDNLNSTSTTDALSANMGRDLQDQINAMSWIGTFLSTWDCATWLPDTNPQQDPYTYKVWDYYIVSAVGATNYKPHWGTFTQWVPSTTVETENVWINDKYYFDWADWVRIPNTAIQITIDSALSTSSTNAVENRAIANAVNAKQDIISDLNTIRSWASAWATALQPNDNISQLINNVGYQTAGDVASAVAWKQDILSAWDWISISNNTVTNTKPWPAISGTAPSNPTEWMLWYDSTNDVLKAYDGSARQEVGSDAADINTKTFYLSSTSDLTTAQAIYDWHAAGKNPIVVYDDKSYTLSVVTSWWITFESAEVLWDVVSNEHTRIGRKTIVLSVTSWSVTSISTQWRTTITNVLATNQDYSSPYVPQYNGSPATKKYVDDSVADVVPSWSTAPQNPQEWDLWYDTVNHVLKIYNWTSRETVDTDTNTTYTAWTNIQISAQNVISATDTTYTAWEGIAISNWNDYSAMRGPCSEWFHVPTKDEWVNLIWILISTFWLTNWNATLKTYLKMPIIGRRYKNDSTPDEDYSTAYYWSCTYWATLVYYLNSFVSWIYPSSTTNSAYWLSVRWFKDVSVTPAGSSWVELFSYNDGWIYHNPTLWLISISSDWIDWITIADKNVWATTVYNDWDTPSEANCWKYYQRWNNYWFPFSWNVLTDNTQVDASTYWPWNYYSSNTFIIWNDSWDSSINKNLWWWETWVVQLHNVITNTAMNENIFVTQLQYDALPSTKLTDWKTYFIY